jgi:hypothetical protein
MPLAQSPSSRPATAITALGIQPVDRGLEVPRQFLPFGFTVIFRLRFECGIPV